eukprot:gnl/TRDRNA2_/TRDRNA2_154245_c1_seq1.p1 gnl/TRDRNA2_/TRDRNA2_154245_c1~~gnl/TRDRNA2_/TRDRNA2_154245_c1_seq1.p1  ORF type:complete len:249 (-),score=33.56 gnl/TRDRNA2_/TRDRNA2_154245_c1_seq1:171-842(-)
MWQASSMFVNPGIRIETSCYCFDEATVTHERLDGFWQLSQREFQDGRAEVLRKQEPGLAQDLSEAIQKANKKLLARAVYEATEAKRTSKNEDFINEYYAAIVTYKELLRAEQSAYPYASLWQTPLYGSATWKCKACGSWNASKTEECPNECSRRPPTREEWNKRIRTQKCVTEHGRTSIEWVIEDYHLEQCARQAGWRPDEFDKAMQAYFADEERYNYLKQHR